MAETTPAQQDYPNLNPYEKSNGNGSVNSKSPKAPDLPQPRIPNPQPAAQSNMDAIKNSQTVQTIVNGPVGEKARVAADNTKQDFSNLAAARTTPGNTTATGQNLTHYHSFFYELLNWSNPRATGVTYAALATLIIATRYLPVARYALKGTYMILGITAAAEIAGKLVLGEGFATKLRPKRYYTLPRETLESVMEDLVELVNFFVIEFQRVVFAEKVEVTVGAFAAALLTYFLIKVTPTWGLTLLFTTLAFFLPLIYIQNQAFIDEHLSNAQDIVNKQASQVRDLAHQHAGGALEASQNAMKEYSAKASEMMGGAKKAAVDKGMVSSDTASKLPGAASSEVKKEDFPTAPKTEPEAAKTHDETQPLLS